MLILNKINTYFNPFNSSLETWKKFQDLSFKNKMTVAAGAFAALVLTSPLVIVAPLASLATFRLLTKKLSPTDEKTQNVAKATLHSLQKSRAKEVPSHTDRNKDQIKAALTTAFTKSPQEGMEALWSYMKEGSLPETEGGNADVARAHFTEGLKTMLGQKKMHFYDISANPNDEDEDEEHFQHRIKKLLPAEDNTLEQCFEVVFQARAVVVDPERAPIPKEHYGRVLAGAIIGGIESSIYRRHAALKKPRNLEHRLGRWREINPSSYGENAEQRSVRFKGDQGVGKPSEFTLEQLDAKYTKYSVNTGQMGRKKEDDPDLDCEYGVAHLRGRRSSQEDAHAVGEITAGGTTVPFFAVCDGHGGESASTFVANNLQTALQRTLADKNLETISDAELENLLASISVKLSDEFFRRQETSDRSGTTLTMALVLPRNGKREVWTTNVGDSRTLAVTENTIHQLTEDASPTTARFKASCEKASIPVYAKCHAPNSTRLFGQLATARAIGDRMQFPISKAKITRMVAG